MTGQYFDIKKFAIHDGPGIRSTLFLKGCPLKCVWCHNPEGIEHEAGLWFFNKKCIQCGKCLSACPEGALSSDSGRDPFIIIDREKCVKCGKCVDICPTTAITFDSSQITLDEAVDKLLQDQLFYGESGGGVTISGGDPLYQYEFTREVLRRCKEQGVHTAIETSMQAKQSVLERLIDVVDLFIVDLKIMDDEMHRKYIGVGNSLIHSNFAMLVEKGVELLVRIPLIPGITALEENIRAVGHFVKSLSGQVPVELINFNPLAVNKYRIMGRGEGDLKDMEPYTEKELDRFYSILEEEGVPLVRENKIDKTNQGDNII